MQSVTDYRYVHHTELKPGAPLYDQGQKQAAISIERYHDLCAAADKKYVFSRNIPPDLSLGQTFPRPGLDFSAYKACKLEPLIGVQLHARSDGTVHPTDIEVYAGTFKKNWKTWEAGILYFIAEEKEFWNMMLNYHSKARTTGIPEWDRLLDQLKAERSPSLVPCMWFARKEGCLDPSCPFLHDKPACQRERALVLEARRVALGQPTARDISQRHDQGVAETRASRTTPLTLADYDPFKGDPALRRLWKERSMVKKICANPECLSVRWKRKPSSATSATTPGGAQTAPEMKACSQCQITSYCSPECQKADWKRHKKEPCLPYEDLINNDDFWDIWGQRKGTGDPMFGVAEH